MKKKLLCALTIIGSIALVGCNNLPDELNSLLSQSGSSEDVSLVTSDSEENTSTSDSEVNSSASEDDNSSDDETSSVSVNNPVSSDSEDNDSEDNPNVSSEGTTTSSDDPITPSEDTSSTPSTSEGTYPTPTPGLEYALNEDGQTASCIGLGTATAEDIVIAPTYQNKPVTIIGEMAFYEEEVYSVKMPNSVTLIGESAFQGSMIEEITFSSNLAIIEAGAFDDCSGLSEVDFPSSLREISDNAFYYNSLTDLIIPEGVNNIGENAFSKGFYLESVQIANSVTEIGSGAFSNNDYLSSFKFGSGCKIIPPSILSGCYELEHLVIPEGVEEIGDQAFMSVNALLTIELPHSLTKLGYHVFVDYGEDVFQKIIYHGTQDEWNTVMDNSDSNWEDLSSIFTIEFDNGDSIQK